jgi:PKD repeat protein
VRDRATTPALTYVLAIGITAVLISGLLIASAGLVDDQRRETVREELEIVGEKLAASVSALDATSDGGGAVSRRIEVPATILDAQYYVDVVDCGSGDACLELTVPDPELDLTVTVPIQNRSAIAVERSRPRSITVTAAAGADPPPTADADVSIDPNIGVAENVEPGLSTGGAVLGNQRSLVVTGFDYEPAPPTMSETITFTADVGGTGAGNLTYAWDFGDGTTVTGNETAMETVTHTYSDPGRYLVELRVEDAAGRNDSVTRLLRVSGLVFEDNKQVIDTDDPSGDNTRATVEFDIRNNFNGGIRITDVLIDPENPDIDRIDNDFDDEIRIESSDQGSYDTGEFRIEETGSIADLDDDATLSDGETATVEMGRFYDGTDQFDMTNQNVSVAFRYQIEGTNRNYVTEFDINTGDADGGDTDAGDPPVIDSVEPGLYGGPFDLFYIGPHVELELSDPDSDLDMVKIEVIDDGTAFYTETNDISSYGGSLDRTFLLGYDDDEGDPDEVRVIVSDSTGNTTTRTAPVSGWP